MHIQAEKTTFLNLKFLSVDPEFCISTDYIINFGLLMKPLLDRLFNLHLCNMDLFFF